MNGGALSIWLLAVGLLVGGAGFAEEAEPADEITAALPLRSSWRADLEAANHIGIGKFDEDDHNVLWAGAWLSVGSDELTASFGARLPLCGDASGTNGLIEGTGPFLRSFDYWETALKLAYNF
jgi:hypothetical protein